MTRKPAIEDLKFDEIGYWSELKLDIVKDYLAEYSKILSAQVNPKLRHAYIDAFAGAGRHISKNTGEFIDGSPLNALNVIPPFCEYYFIDMNAARVVSLKKIAGERPNVHVYEGDCNTILIDKVFPNVQYSDYKRGVCLLDPYGLHLDWKVIETAGKMRSIDMFLHFPVADMNRNVLWRNPQGISDADIERMNIYWGDESWKKIVYGVSPQGDLFREETLEKFDNSNEIIVAAFIERLKGCAKFKHVPKPVPMRNSKGNIVYYLIFASQKLVANKLIEYIFKKYRMRGVSGGN